MMARPPAPRRPTRMPILRTADLDPRDFARSTCFDAGHLVTKNAGWRNVRPVVDRDACTGCLQCYLYCPDGTVYKVADDGSGTVAIDYDFCKGCGICAKVCAFGAVTMVSEREALAAEALSGSGNGSCNDGEDEEQSR